MIALGGYILAVFWMIGAPPDHTWQVTEVRTDTVIEACAQYRRLVTIYGEPWNHVVLVLDTPGSTSRGLTGVTCGRAA